MQKSGKKLVKVPKQAGGRRPKKVAKRPARKTPADYYKDKKGNPTLFPKRLNQYRFLIFTDLEPDDLGALTMFTAWIKANENFFDSHNRFPIYGFVVGEGDNMRVKAIRARDFLNVFGEDLMWDDPEHHHYNGWYSAGNRVWYDTKTDTKFVGEEKLIQTEDALDSDDYPDPEPLVNTIDELMKAKPSNIFALYLKPLRFFQNFKDRPEVIEYLRKIPGAMYGSWNVRTIIGENPALKPQIMHFLNRKKNEAPLIYAESFLALGEDNVVTIDNSPRLFREMDDAGEDEMLAMMNSAMFAWNDNIVNSQIAKLQDLPEFEDTDFDDYQSFQNDLKKLSSAKRKQYNSTIKIVDSILKTNSRQFVFADPLVIIAMLMANGNLKTPIFKLQRSVIEYDSKYISQDDSHASNTHVLLPTEPLTPAHNEKARKLLESMLLAAVKLTLA